MGSELREMKIFKSYECMNACILNHINRFGAKISGSDIFFSGRGYPISSQKGKVTRISSEGYEANFRFMNQYGVEYKFGRVPPEKELLLSLLESSDAITIRTASDFLTYDPVFSQTSGASHFINILDYNDNKKEFYIVDGDVPSAQTGVYAGWLNESDVMNGWAAKRGEILTLTLSGNIIESKRFCQKVREDANNQVKQSITQYLKGKNHFFRGCSTGEEAIICMIQVIEKYLCKKDFREITMDANFRLRVDGYMGAKKFLLEKLREQKKIRMAEEYKELIDRWSRWCMLLLKSGLSATVENFSIVKNRMQELIQQEHRILERY